MEAEKNFAILPRPRMLRWKEGWNADGDEKSAVFLRDGTLAAQAYRLRVDPGRIRVWSGGEQGAFYARQTLRQLRLQSPRALPCCEIDDAPGLAVRGLMMDISRDKIPTLETLYGLADLMALLKMNHLELYIEGFSFAYPSFTEFWMGETPVTPEEFRSLDAYCRERWIDLVPCQNSLGHMAAWLGTRRFRRLAERETESEILGMRLPPATLNPLDEGSLGLVGSMCADLLPCFSSGFCNVCLDEPMDLGSGRSRRAAGAPGPAGLYLDYLRKLDGLMGTFGKKMLMWGDFIARHPALLGEIPGDVTVLDWGYEAEHPFAARAAALREHGVRFYLCPGTSSWSSFAGITENMQANIRAAADAAHRYGAAGLVVTDWGDGGHMQYLPVSYAGLALAAALAWNGEELGEAELETWLDRVLYRDRAEVMGAFTLELGRYSRYEGVSLPCRTLTSLSVLLGALPAGALEHLLEQAVTQIAPMMVPEVYAVYKEKFGRRGRFDYEGLSVFLREMEEKLENARMECADARLIRREFRNAIRMLELGSGLLRLSSAENGALAELADAARAEHEALWLERNKPGGLARSLRPLDRIRGQLRQPAP